MPKNKPNDLYQTLEHHIRASTYLTLHKRVRAQVFILKVQISQWLLTLSLSRSAARRFARTGQSLLVAPIWQGGYRIINDTARSTGGQLDRMVQNHGHAPESRAGRIYRQVLVARCLALGMIINLIFAIVSPTTMPITLLYILLCVFFVWRSTVERRQLAG